MQCLAIHTRTNIYFFNTYTQTQRICLALQAGGRVLHAATHSLGCGAPRRVGCDSAAWLGGAQILLSRDNSPPLLTSSLYSGLFVCFCHHKRKAPPGTPTAEQCVRHSSDDREGEVSQSKWAKGSQGSWMENRGRGPCPCTHTCTLCKVLQELVLLLAIWHLEYFSPVLTTQLWLYDCVWTAVLLSWFQSCWKSWKC